MTKHTTKKRLLSVLLTLCMAVALCAGLLVAAPVKVKADNGTATWNSSTPPDISGWDGAGNTVTVSSGAKGTLTIPAAVTEISINSDGNAVTDANIVVADRAAGQDLTINFDNLNMTAPAGTDALGYLVATAVNITLNVANTVRLTGGAGASGIAGTAGGCGIFLNANTTVAGTGTLYATGGIGGNGTTGNGAIGGDGIFTQTGLTTVAGNLVVTGGNGGDSQSGNGGMGGFGRVSGGARLPGCWAD